MRKELFEKLEKSLQQAIEAEKDGYEKKTIEKRQVGESEVKVKRIGENSLE